jgi:hypothetical protein
VASASRPFEREFLHILQHPADAPRREPAAACSRRAVAQHRDIAILAGRAPSLPFAMDLLADLQASIAFLTQRRSR